MKEKNNNIFYGFGLTPTGTPMIVKQCTLGYLGKLNYFSYLIPNRGACILVMEKGEQSSLTWRSGQFSHKR